jgi:hypothetical protein
MRLKNTGTATSTLLSCFINDEEIDTYDATGALPGVWATNINQTTTTLDGFGKSWYDFNLRYYCELQDPQLRRNGLHQTS